MKRFIVHRIGLPLLAAVISALALAATASAAPGPVLAGSWFLGEGAGRIAHDSSGQGNDGLLTPGVGWVTLDGRPGVAFAAGSSAAIVVPQSPSLEPAGALTLTAWVRNQGSPGPYSYIVAKGASSCTSASYGLYSGPNGGAAFYVATGRGPAYRLSPALTAGQIWDGRWHQLVGTYDGTSIRLYLDGVQVGSGTAYSAPIQYALTDSNKLLLGNYAVPPAAPSGCQTRSFPGGADEVSLWSVALSPAYLRALYLAESYLPVPTGDPVLGMPPPPAPTSARAPALSSLSVSAPAPAPAAASDGRRARHAAMHGVIVSYADSARALTTIRVLRSGARTPVATLVHGDAIGRNRFLLGRVHGRLLRAGRYRLELVPAGRRSATVKTTFAIR